MWLSIRWLQYKLHRFYCSVRHSSSLLFKRLQFDCMSFLHTSKSNSVIVLMLWYPVEVVFCVSRLFQWDSLKFGFKSIFWWQSLQIWLNADRKLHLHHNTAGYKQKRAADSENTPVSDHSQYDETDYSYPSILVSCCCRSTQLCSALVKTEYACYLSELCHSTLWRVNAIN